MRFFGSAPLEMEKEVNLSDNCLRVVSCSGLSKVKRVEIMIKSFQFVDFPIRWHHLGDGRLRVNLKRTSNHLDVDDKFIFDGLVPTRSRGFLYRSYIRFVCKYKRMKASLFLSWRLSLQESPLWQPMLEVRKKLWMTK